MANQEQDQGSGSGKPRGDGRRSERGFAAMDPVQQRQIAAEGGRAAHLKGTAHEFTSEEAREAGRKGGEKTALSRAGAAQAASGNPGRSGGTGARPGRPDAGVGSHSHAGGSGRPGSSDGAGPDARSGNRDN